MISLSLIDTESHRSAIMAVGNGRVVSSLVTLMTSTIEKVWQLERILNSACAYVCEPIVTRMRLCLRDDSML